jgi:hypothetical protein
MLFNKTPLRPHTIFHPHTLPGGSSESEEVQHLGFDAIAFSEDGQFLVTVSKEPNRLLTVWYWQHAEGSSTAVSSRCCHMG